LSNDENIMVIGDLDELDPVRRAAQTILRNMPAQKLPELLQT